VSEGLDPVESKVKINLIANAMSLGKFIPLTFLVYASFSWEMVTV
jgi:hypothetical protein